MSALHSSLRTRLTLIVLLAVIPLAALLVYNALRDRAAADDEVREAAQLLVQQSVERQEQLIEASRQIMASLAGLASMTDVDSLNPESCGTAFGLILRDLTFYQNVGIASSDGMALCSADPIGGSGNVASTAWFQRAISSGLFSIGVYEPDGVNSEPTLSFGYPIRNAAGDISLLLFLTLDIARFNDPVSSQELLGDARLTIRDSNGTILLSYPDQTRVGETTAEPLGTEGVDSVTDADGVERLRAFTFIGEEPGSGMYASVSLPRSEGYAAANAELRRNLVVLVVVTILALLATYLVSDRLIVSPIRRLILLTRRVSSGDLRARAEIHGSGELHALGESLNEMAEALDLRGHQRDEAESRLLDANARLHRTVADLKRSNTDLEQFAYVASHDLQEPLRMVSSYTQLLAQRYQDQLDSDANDFIGFAVDGAHRMQALINDLLDFSRVGTTGVPFARVDMAQVVERVKTDLKFRLEETGAVLTHDTLPGVQGDEIQIQQLLQNLVSNALKFRSDAPPRIHIAAEENEGSWRFSVRDNGIGVPTEHRDRVFVIFQRLHGRERYAGNGIGLSISKRIVERHGGTIWVESHPAGGSVFCFTLPRVGGAEIEAGETRKLDVA